MPPSVPALPLTRLKLYTGVELDVALAGPEHGEPIIFLHGFPESHRTWRHQFQHFSQFYRVIAPDQRGYAGSDKPSGVRQYGIEYLVSDILALADTLELDRFTLASHDWGGAIGWALTIAASDRVKKLIIANAPHPWLFQKALIDNREQQMASQYINAFRNPDFEKHIEEKGLEQFFADNFLAHVDASKIDEQERGIYLQQWSTPGALTAMLNWYRASPIIVPEPGQKAELPQIIKARYPAITTPVQVIWGMQDKALRPVLIEGLDKLIEDYTLVKIPEAGHFTPWECPDKVIEAMENFILR